MASSLYDAGRSAFMQAQINWVTDDIRCCLLDTTTGTGGYTFSQSHTIKGNLTGIVADMSTSMTGKTATGGVARADNVTFSNVSGNSIEALAIYKQSTGVLIAYIEGFNSISPNAGSIQVTWDTGSYGIFKL